MNKRVELEDVETEEVVADIEEVDLTEGDEEEQEEQTTEGDGEEEGDSQQTEAESDEITVFIEGEEPDESEPDTSSAPDWVKELRRKNREDKRRIRELEEKLKEKEGPEADDVLPKKPEPEDVNYDLTKHEAALLAWYEKKKAHEERKKQREAEQDRVNQEWQEKLQGYQEAKTTLKVSDYDDAEEIVQETLSVTQQGMILQGADNPALLVYALGRNPKKAKELAGISDPVKFAFAVAKLETQLKTASKKPASKPEKVLSGGTGRASAAVDSTLDRLREEAARTGDMSKVIAYKRKMKK